MGLATVAAAAAVLLLGWGYRAALPPAPKICGTAGGPPVTSPRVRLSDGRHLAYKEWGIPKHEAKHKVVVVHGFGDDKEFCLVASQDLVEELGVYFLTFDRAGYGESDPNPKRSVRSDALDVQQIADLLGLGPKFYLVGVSMGAYPTYGCMKYLPHRLAGVALVAPAINFWWPSFPANISREVWKKILPQDQKTFVIAHHAPFLLYWWMTQKWFPSFSFLEEHPVSLNELDKEVLLKTIAQKESTGVVDKARQQGVFESLHRDFIVVLGNWEFDPMDMSNPFVDNESSVHIWQGSDDRMISAELQRFLVQKLPWVQYHEIPEAGHLFVHLENWSNDILSALVLPHEHSVG